MRARIKIDVVADIVCPWCLVGIRRLDNALMRLSPDLDIEIERHPFLLDPDIAAEGDDVVAYLTQKFGRPPHSTWQRLEAEALASGLHLEMTRQKFRYPTVDAHTLIRHARDKGTQHAFANDLAAAYFIEARNIADPEVLVEVAGRHAFSARETRELLADKEAAALTRAQASAVAAQGIDGVPFFIFDNRLALSGCQPEEIFDRALAAALSEGEPIRAHA
jgi:predicted DsbA family dithiol-disulfide isomerase